MGLSYGALIKAMIHIKKVHLYSLKRFLGVDMKTPNDHVYGETDRFPITLNSAIRCIRCWLKLTCMGEDRLPSKAYNYDVIQFKCQGEEKLGFKC